MSPTSHSSEVSKDLPASRKTRWPVRLLFVLALAAGILFTIGSIHHDLQGATSSVLTWTAIAMLGVALFIALGFEFVNGFHDTANAVATVIYTHSLAPTTAVVWAGLCNFFGVLLSSGAVAYGVVALLPVDLVLNNNVDTGFAMVFALLISAIAWNLFTWWRGIPASSSHTLIGSMIGVGLANALIHHGNIQGVNWGQATKIAYALLFSPLIGFVFAGLMLLAFKLFVKNKALYEAPRDGIPPPMWIRAMLIASSSGVSFAHGSNDGQKGMGLIMLILVSLVPAAYALDRYSTHQDLPAFTAAAHETQLALVAQAPQAAPEHPAQVLKHYLSSHEEHDALVPALATLSGEIHDKLVTMSSFKDVPSDQIRAIHDDMYIVSESIGALSKSEHIHFDTDTKQHMTALKGHIDGAIKFIPVWVKVVTALALGLGTVVGWRRVVHTVGEKIGKSRMTYAQGVSAQTVAMATIGAADVIGLPVSTTHVLSSGVAGTMAANRSGLQWSTLRNLAMTWILTVPVTILLSGSLYWLFLHL